MVLAASSLTLMTPKKSASLRQMGPVATVKPRSLISSSPQLEPSALATHGHNAHDKRAFLPVLEEDVAEADDTVAGTAALAVEGLFLGDIGNQ
jgi:hypothetical protein